MSPDATHRATILAYLQDGLGTEDIAARTDIGIKEIRDTVRELRQQGVLPSARNERDASGGRLA